MRLFRASAYIFLTFTAAAQSAFAAGDLITADKTVFVQFAIFLVALYLLNVLFFRPLIYLADKRESATSGSSREAEELTAKSEELTARYNAEVKEARERAAEERTLITKAAIEEADGIVSSAREEARALLDERTAELSAEVEKTKSEMSSEIEEIAVMITRAAGGGKDA